MILAYDLLAIGAVAVDDLVYLDGHPTADGKMPIREERREGGGLAGTALVAAARLGARAAYLGVLGHDDLSRFTLAELVREGVDCSHVHIREGARPVHSVILVDRLTGTRTILFNLAGVQPPAMEDVDANLIASCRVLFVDSTLPAVALHAVRLAQDCRAPVVADLEHADRPGVPELAQVVDHLIVGVNFASRLTGATDPADMVTALWHAGRAACVVTAGERGCWYVGRETDGEVCHQPAYPVHIVDTTGCGDVFHGAYAARLAAGDDLATRIAAASATAALKATQPGGRRGIPDWMTVRRFMEAPSGHNDSA